METRGPGRCPFRTRAAVRRAWSKVQSQAGSLLFPARTPCWVLLNSPASHMEPCPETTWKQNLRNLIFPLLPPATRLGLSRFLGGREAAVVRLTRLPVSPESLASGSGLPGASADCGETAWREIRWSKIKMNLLDVPLGFPFTELLQAGPRGCLVHNPGPSRGRRGLPGGRSGAESHLPTAGQPPALCGRGSLPGKSPCEMQSGLRANPWTFGSVCFTSVTEA